MNLAGRFWLGYFIALALGCFLASESHAGYNATITSSAYSSCAAGRVSNGCFLTVGMAIYSACNYGIVVKAIDSSASTFQAFASANQSQLFSGTFATCTAVASGTNQPPLSAGASDPGLVEGGISVGGSSMNLITNADDAALIAAAFMTLFAIAGGWRLLRSAIDVGDLPASDERH